MGIVKRNSITNVEATG